jgi:hypothetical protein
MSPFAKAVGMRVFVWGGVALLALTLLGDWRSLFVGSFGPTTASPGLADDQDEFAGWPHLRGPKYNSASPETGLLDSWPERGPPVLWLRDVGTGYSGLSAAGQQVFTQRQTTYYQSVLCLDADRGEPMWEYRYGWPYEAAGMYPGPRATPTWYEGRVYFAAPDGLVGCLDARDGRLLWSRNVTKEFDGQGTDFGYSASPTVEAGKVILPVGGAGASVVALDARDGSTAWASGDHPAELLLRPAHHVPRTLSGGRLSAKRFGGARPDDRPLALAATGLGRLRRTCRHAAVRRTLSAAGLSVPRGSRLVRTASGRAAERSQGRAASRSRPSS